MGPDLGCFFDEADGEILPFFGCQLLEPDRCSKARGAAANDQDVEFHGLPFHLCLLEYGVLVFLAGAEG